VAAKHLSNANDLAKKPLLLELSPKSRHRLSQNPSPLPKSDRLISFGVPSQTKSLRSTLSSAADGPKKGDREASEEP